MSTLYVCENCGRLGPMDAFQDECRPGWTHGRLIKIKERCDRSNALWRADWQAERERAEQAERERDEIRGWLNSAVEDVQAFCSRSPQCLDARYRAALGRAGAGKSVAGCDGKEQR